MPRPSRPHLLRLGTLLLAGMGLGGCSALLEMPDGPPDRWVDLNAIPEPVPQPVTRTAAGNPPHYSVDGVRYEVLKSSQGYKARGIASWYGRKFHGRPTSNGETFDMFAISAAHRTLPLPTYARVTNTHNGQSLVVRINDRGPFKEGRIIDLSYAAAAKLDIIRTGTAEVEVEALETPVMNGLGKATTPAQDEPIFLQVGAFSERNNAERLRSELATKLASNKVHIVDAGDALHRVQIGPIHQVEESDRIRHRLQQVGIHNIRLIGP